MEEDLEENLDLDALENMLEELVERLASYLSDVDGLHVIDGELTDLPPTMLDSIH